MNCIRRAIFDKQPVCTEEVFSQAVRKSNRMASMLMTENMAMTTTPVQLLPRAFPPEDIVFTPVVN